MRLLDGAKDALKRHGVKEEDVSLASVFLCLMCIDSSVLLQNWKKHPMNRVNRLTCRGAESYDPID